MSLRQRIKLEIEDGADVKEVVVTYDGRDLRAWENKHHKSSLTENMSLDMLTWLGWSAGRRSGDLNGQFDDYKAFDAVCISVEGLRDEEPDVEERPTGAQKARTPKSRGAGSSAP